MKLIFILFCLISLYRCDPVSGAAEKIQDEPDSVHAGVIYTSKVILFLDRDSEYIAATRLSSFQPEKSVDTLRLWGSIVSVDSKNKPVNENIYCVVSNPGEQIYFESKDQIKFALRESSTVYFSYKSNEVRLVRVYGEAYLETPHAVKITSDNTIEMAVKAGSSINVKNDLWGKIAISLTRGKAYAEPGYLNDYFKPTLLTASNQIGIDVGARSWQFRKFDSSVVSSWRNAYQMRFAKANLAEIMKRLDQWHRTITIYDSLPSDLYTLTIPYNGSLTKTIESLKIICDRNFKLDGDTIYVLPIAR